MERFLQASSKKYKCGACIDIMLIYIIKKRVQVKISMLFYMYFSVGQMWTVHLKSPQPLIHSYILISQAHQRE